MAREMSKLVADYTEKVEEHVNNGYSRAEDEKVEVTLEIKFRDEKGIQKISGDAIPRTLDAIATYVETKEDLSIEVKEVNFIK